MAVRSVTATPFGMNCILYEWLGLLNGDTGEPVDLGEYGDITVTLEPDPTSGAFGAGGTIKLQGGNVAGSAYDLTDPQGNAISKTVAAIEVVSESPRWVFPNVTAGDGTTKLACRIKARRSR